MKIHVLVMSLIVALSVAISSPVLANDQLLAFDGSYDDFANYYGNDEFVTIATGSSKPVYKAPAVASVITAKQIKEMGATTLDDVLETISGLHIALSAVNRLDSVYSIRGIHTGMNAQVLMLMNGIPFPYVYTGARPALFNLPITAISRVEVLRGPGSAVYGADAYSGVINIITKDGSEIDGSHIGLRSGSFDSNELWLQHGNSYGKWDIAFSFNYTETDGDTGRKISSDLQTTFDQAFGTNASLAPGSLSTRYTTFDTHLEIKRGNWGLRLWNWKLEDAGIGAGGAQALDPDGRQDTNQFLADLSYRNDQLLQDVELEITTSYLHRKTETEFTLLSAGATIPIGSDGNLDFAAPAGIVSFSDGLFGYPGGTDNQLNFDLAVIYSGFSSHNIRLGGGLKYLRYHPEESKNFGPGVIDGTQSPVNGSLTNVSDTPYAFSPTQSRTLRYFSVQDEWTFAPDWELTSGVRYDHYSDFGPTFNPRIALVWSARYNLTAKLLYGSAFRAPSFSELTGKNNPVSLGNPDLDPETIETYELAFDYRPTFDIQTNLSLFAYQAKDLISIVQDDGATTKTAQNAKDQDGYGFEIEANWQATDNLDVSASYAWQHSEDKQTDQRVADAPRQQIYLSSHWQFIDGYHLSPQIIWIGDRARAATDTRSEIDDYTLVNLTLRIDSVLNKNFQLAISCRNIFDEDAYEPSSGTIADDYPLASRSVWVELSYRFDS